MATRGKSWFFGNDWNGSIVCLTPTARMYQVIDWTLNEEKIDWLYKSTIEDSKTRCSKIVEAPVKDEHILKVRNKEIN